MWSVRGVDFGPRELLPPPRIALMSSPHPLHQPWAEPTDTGSPPANQGRGAGAWYWTTQTRDADKDWGRYPLASHIPIIPCFPAGSSVLANERNPRGDAFFCKN